MTVIQMKLRQVQEPTYCDRVGIVLVVGKEGLKKTKQLWRLIDLTGFVPVSVLKVVICKGI